MNALKCIVREVAKTILMGVVWAAPLKAIQLTGCQKCAWLFVASLIATFSIMAHYSRVETQGSQSQSVDPEIKDLQYEQQ